MEEECTRRVADDGAGPTKRLGGAGALARVRPPAELFLTDGLRAQLTTGSMC